MASECTSWYQLRCKYRAKKAGKAANEAAAEQKKWDALDYIPEDLSEQTMQLVKLMAFVGIRVLLILAWAVKQPKKKLT